MRLPDLAVRLAADCPKAKAPDLGERCWVYFPQLAAGSSGAESRGAGHRGNLMTAVALAVWWQALARV